MNNSPALPMQNARPVIVDRVRATALLARYPQLSAREKDEILTFLKSGRQIEIGLLMSDKKVQPSLDRFMVEHAGHFPAKLHPGAVVTFAIALTVILLGLIEMAVA